jgi:hypothetical protein
MYKDDNDDRLVRGHTDETWRSDDWVHSAQDSRTLEEKLDHTHMNAALNGTQYSFYMTSPDDE